MKEIVTFLFLIVISINSYSQNNRELLIRDGNTVKNNSVKSQKSYAEKFNLGLNIGAIYPTYGKEFNKIFDGNLGLSIGIDFYYKNLFLGFNILYASSQLKQDLVVDDFFLINGKRSMINNGNITFGYSVYETHRFRILPVIGYGGFTFVETSENRTDGSGSIKNITFGLNFDLKSNKKTSTKRNLFGYYERNNYFIRAKIFMSNSIGKSAFKGYSINLGLVLGIQGSMLKSIN